MKALKRIISVVCIITMLVLCVPVSASAATATKTKAEALAWVKSQSGKTIEADGSPEGSDTWAQCVDFTKAYLTYLGITPINGHAAQYATKSIDTTKLTRLQGETAQAGDIMIWTGGEYGHVAVKGSDGIYHQNVDITPKDGVFNPVHKVVMTQEVSGLTFWGVIRPKFKDSSSSSSLGFTPAKITAGNYYIMNKATGKYLAVSYGKDADGQNVQVAPFGSTTAFQHNISAASTGYKIRPLCSSSRLVNPDADSVSNGVNINLYKNVSSSDQWWYFQSAGSGYYYIRNVQNPSVALAVDNTSADYPNVYVATYTSGNSKQMWRLDTTSTYAIKYNANGGSGAPSSQTKYHNRDIKLSSTKPTRTGYKFKGWSTSSTATSASYAAGATYSKNTKATLYAVWEPNTLTIKYHTNGGSIDSTTYSASSGKICKNGSQYIKTYSYNNILHENGLTNASTFGLYKTGYTFTGWSTSKSGGTVFDQNDGTLKPTDITSKINTGDCTVTLYAQWEQIQDINGDGKINQKDVTALSRYLAKGWSVAINQTPADTNGDGKINQKDVTVLSRYLAGGWGVTLAQ